jgi:RNA polymerase sigma-70 factor, ECF subfamily
MVRSQILAMRPPVACFEAAAERITRVGNVATPFVAMNMDMSETPGSTRYDATPLSNEAQTRFVNDNMRRVFLLIYRIVGNVPDAQDLTQEAFIKALQRQDQLKDPEKAAHWLSRIATNTAIDFLRRNDRVSFSDLENLPERVVTALDDDPEQSVLRSERRDRLSACLEVLTERERTALLLRDVEDLPAEEVAEQLNCSKATVRSHIANARVKLRKHFERMQRRGVS